MPHTQAGGCGVTSAIPYSEGGIRSRSRQQMGEEFSLLGEWLAGTLAHGIQSLGTPTLGDGSRGL